MSQNSGKIKAPSFNCTRCIQETMTSLSGAQLCNSLFPLLKGSEANDKQVKVRLWAFAFTPVSTGSHSERAGLAFCSSGGAF